MTAKQTVVKRGRGRPPIGPVFKLRLDDELHAQLTAAAQAEQVAAAELARRILRERLTA